MIALSIKAPMRFSINMEGEHHSLLFHCLSVWFSMSTEDVSPPAWAPEQHHLSPGQDFNSFTAMRLAERDTPKSRLAQYTVNLHLWLIRRSI